jgi:hypothetical protein
MVISYACSDAKDAASSITSAVRKIRNDARHCTNVAGPGNSFVTYPLAVSTYDLNLLALRAFDP